jgi:glucosamine 6-phosphate synthetase-like amidotransferase/phosphosugar isomerase protein
MCGIVAYLGRKAAQPLLIEGLERLEYRGYDSWGIALMDTEGELHVRRAVGRISVLEETLEKRRSSVSPTPGGPLMAHTLSVMPTRTGTTRATWFWSTTGSSRTTPPAAATKRRATATSRLPRGRGARLQRRQTGDLAKSVTVE